MCISLKTNHWLAVLYRKYRAKIRNSWRPIFSKKKSFLIVFIVSCHFTSFHLTPFHFISSSHFANKIPFMTSFPISFTQSLFISIHLHSVICSLYQFPQLNSVSAARNWFFSQLIDSAANTLLFSIDSQMLAKCRYEKNMLKHLKHQRKAANQSLMDKSGKK